MEQDLPKFNHIVRNSGAQVALTDGTVSGHDARKGHGPSDVPSYGQHTMHMLLC